MIEGSGEDDVWDFEFTLSQFLKDAEAVEPGHLDVQEDQIWRMFFDQVYGVEAIFALGQEMNLGEGFQEKGEFFAGGLFVVNDDGVDGHWGGQFEYSAGHEDVASHEWRRKEPEWL
jgi:hypothetical protein